MRRRLRVLFLAIAALLSVPSIRAQELTREHVLENGSVMKVPADAVAIPGQPVIVPYVTLSQAKQAKLDYLKNGYVDQPNDVPMFAKTSSELRNRIQASGLGDKSQVYRLEEFRKTSSDATGRMGKVSAEYLHGNGEALVEPALNGSLRLYTDTEFGDVVVHEIYGNVSMGSATNEPPNFSVGGAEGYLTVIRFAGGEIRTQFALKTKRGFAFLEVGPMSDRSRLESMISSFAVLTENQ